jgi:hypothetical protein
MIRLCKITKSKTTLDKMYWVTLIFIQSFLSNPMSDHHVNAVPPRLSLTLIIQMTIAPNFIVPLRFIWILCIFKFYQSAARTIVRHIIGNKEHLFQVWEDIVDLRCCFIPEITISCNVFQGLHHMVLVAVGEEAGDDGFEIDRGPVLGGHQK